MAVTNEELATSINELRESVKRIEEHILSHSSNITLKKLAKGYGWEIKLFDNDPAKLVDGVKSIDAKLRETYGGGEV